MFNRNRVIAGLDLMIAEANEKAAQSETTRATELAAIDAAEMEANQRLGRIAAKMASHLRKGKSLTGSQLDLSDPVGVPDEDWEAHKQFIYGERRWSSCPRTQYRAERWESERQEVSAVEASEKVSDLVGLRDVLTELDVDVISQTLINRMGVNFRTITEAIRTAAAHDREADR